jgi:hypothetical protein
MLLRWNVNFSQTGIFRVFSVLIINLLYTYRWGGGLGAQRAVLRVNEPKKAGARSEAKTL